MKKITVIFFLIATSCYCTAQHIQYRDKKKPAENKNSSAPSEIAKPVPVVVTKPAIIAPDTLAKSIVKAEEKKPIIKDTVIKNIPPPVDTPLVLEGKEPFKMKPKLKKPYVEEQNMCNLMSRPEVAAQLPLVLNRVIPEMLKMLKERYKGRLYSITALNMIDQRLKFKLKICDKNNGKFRSEYLDQDGNVVNDPALDYE